ncbi:MAG: HAD family hydrolase [Planctomycetes bacterium]|nr:HAD family hydrolase [Planctomycetota bacterium]
MTSSPGTITAVFFDVDGTIVDATIAHYLRYFMLRHLPAWRRPLWDVSFMARCLYYMAIDRIDRSRFNRLFYRNYAGLPAREIIALAEDCDRKIAFPRTFDQSISCIREHQAARRRIVLVSGSLDFIVRPIADRLHADHVEAASLIERNGFFTGELAGAVVGSEEKARRIREYARTEGIDLAQSHAYGDSIADLPMLEAVGFPHAVNPDRKLRRQALSRDWPIHQWTLSTPRTDS